jgi:hypothetical protein
MLCLIGAVACAWMMFRGRHHADDQSGTDEAKTGETVGV